MCSLCSCMNVAEVSAADMSVCLCVDVVTGDCDVIRGLHTNGSR